MEEYLDIKQRTRPFKRRHSQVKPMRVINKPVNKIKNEISVDKNGNIKDSNSRGGSGRRRYASTKGFKI